MKTKFLTLLLFSILFLQDFVLFAQGTTPGTDDGGGGLEGDDPPPAPINAKLIVLAIFGILLAASYFRQQKQKA